MDQHLSHATLVSYLSGQAAGPQVGTAISHLAGCEACRIQATGVIEDLAYALAEEDRRGEKLLLAHARWAELASLAPGEQIKRIHAREELQTQEMFDTVLSEAARLAKDDPYPGEEVALVAHALAGKLTQQSEARRNDHQGIALMEVGTCRRLAADWRGSAAALKAARSHLERGTGEPAFEAKLLSMQASLATDTGHIEQAEALLGRAAALYRKAGDLTAVAAAAVKEANILLAACRHEEALCRAQEALNLLPSKDTRLEILARNIMTACLVFLERPDEALKSYRATCPLREQHSERRSELQAEYLEALLFDSFGLAREAETSFRNNIANRMEAEAYKDAFLTMLIRFELLFRRGELAKAAQACEEALEAIQRAGKAGHSQLEAMWRDLLTLVQARRLTEHQVLLARRYLLRHWSVPGDWNLPLDRAGERAPQLQRYAEPAPNEIGTASLIESYPAPALLGETFEAALGGYDRSLIRKGLSQAGGCVSKASRQLGIAPATLRAKIRKYGLGGGVTEAAETARITRPGKVNREALAPERARAWWREIRSQSTTAVRLSQIKAVPAYQTRELVEAMLEDAVSTGSGAPLQGDKTASLAYEVAGILSPIRCLGTVKHDLQCKALRIAANCRRLAGNWQGASAALHQARAHLRQGTGAPALEARLLAIQASLATDMGHLSTITQISPVPIT